MTLSKTQRNVLQILAKGRELSGRTLIYHDPCYWWGKWGLGGPWPNAPRHATIEALKDRGLVEVERTKSDLGPWHLVVTITDAGREAVA